MNSPTALSPVGRNPWPIGIISFFVVFIAFIAWFITFATRQKMDLVRDDYYDQEIRFQQQIDRVQRTQAVSTQVAITSDAVGDFITIGLPKELSLSKVSGTVLLYRPSDASLDQQCALQLGSDGFQRVDARALPRGLWKVRVQWTLDGKDYFYDKNIVLKRPPASS
jgi:nitrogen fixation protein FixH